MSITINCPECGTSCRTGSKFCISCAFPLGNPSRGQGACSRGHKVDPSWKECPFCKGMDDDFLIGNRPEVFAHVADQRQNNDLLAKDDPLPASSSKLGPLSPPGKIQVPVSPGSVRSDVVSPQDGTQKTICGVLVTWSWKQPGQAYLLRVGRNYIGSANGAQVSLNAPGMSPKHALIVSNGSQFVLDDCLSEGGTWLNGKPVMEKAPLKHGDVIQTGETLWSFSRLAPPDPRFRQP